MYCSGSYSAAAVGYSLSSWTDSIQFKEDFKLHSTLDWEPM